MQTQAVQPSFPQTSVVLLKKQHEHDDVWSFYFERPSGYIYEAGEYVHVRVALADPHEKSVREFSFASAPGEAHIQFTIDTRSGSAYQRALQALTEGETVTLFKNKRHMAWPVREERIVCIANGIGITPFRSMCGDIQNAALPVQMTLMHVARDAFLFHDEFVRMADAYMPLRRAGFEDALRAVASSHPAARYYVAGSPMFVESVAQSLQSLGIAHIETDAFKGYAGE